MATRHPDVLGIDIGGVIITHGGGKGDTQFFSDAFLETPAVPGAIEGIAHLVRTRFGEGTHIVSKCGPAVAAKSLAWLDAQHFFERTGIARDRVHFCLTRQGKAPICEALGITHFIDDRIDVLGYLTSVPNRYLLDLAGRHPDSREEITRVRSWDAIVAALSGASAGGGSPN